MVTYFFDVHIPITVKNQLEKRGVGVLTAQLDQSATLPDHELLFRATQLGRCMVTSDIRFRALAEAWQQTQRPFAGLVYAHPMHVTIGQMVLDLELIAKAIGADEFQNQVVYLPL